MNDQQFERDTEALRHRGYVSFVEAVRARDTAQREALAQLQAEMPDLRANMTKALDLLQVLTSTKYTHRAFVEAVDEADEMLEQLRGKVVMKGLADQQEAQAAAYGDEVVAVVGTVPDGSGFKSLDFKVELQDLPDGTRLYAQGVGGAST